MSRLLPVALVLAPIGVFVVAVQAKSHRDLMLPGTTSAGHHQIESKCESCHTPLQGVNDQSCRNCHAAALAEQNDSHAADSFLDPGRADMLTSVDARSCLSCHREHRPEARQRNSVSVAADFCFPCHDQIARQWPSHRHFSSTSCADVGCHNYHDNRALYQDLAARERDVPPLRIPAALPRSSAIVPYGEPLDLSRADVDSTPLEPPVVSRARVDWAASSHAAGGVNCSHCHRDPAGAADGDWQVAPAVCGACHGVEQTGFLAGKHGMRVAAGLSPMSPRQARLPMQPDARDRSLGCNSCHGAHDFATERAGLEACEGCHADAHTRAYRQSSHFAVLQSERAGQRARGAGVSCASCHLPHRQIKDAAGVRVVTVHNQNDNLRPVDRMARDVCIHCHGLGYALQALADADLVARNFTGAPQPRPRQ